MHGCRFSNCTHVHEPGCAIQKAIAEGKISKSRYNNYLGILTDDYWKEAESDYRNR
jgi:ribosome biogenesis GTPase